MAAKVESATGQTSEERLEEFHKRLASSSLAGHWQARTQVPKLKPWVWRWKDIYSALEEAGELVPMGGAGAATNRRTVQLINPALTGVKSTSRTLHVSIQLVKPGETAEAHRHAFCRAVQGRNVHHGRRRADDHGAGGPPGTARLGLA